MSVLLVGLARPALSVTTTGIAAERRPQKKSLAKDDAAALSADDAFRLTSAETAEGILLFADWLSDGLYALEIVTRTTEPPTDKAVRDCLSMGLAAIGPNASAVCGAGSAFSGAAAVALCESRKHDFEAPAGILALLCMACLVGIAGDIYRTHVIIKTKKAYWRSQTDGWGSHRQAAQGEVTILKQAKENAMIVCTLLEDGLGVSCTVLLETYYVHGPWDALAQLSVTAAMAALAFKVFWALHNRELARQKLLAPGGLHAAAAAGDFKGVKWLILECGRQVDEPAGFTGEMLGNDVGWDRTGQTPLVSAARNGHLGVLGFLLGQGADVNATTADGRSALISASAGCHVDCVHMLCQADGIDVDLCFLKFGVTALHVAVMNPEQAPADEWDQKALATVRALLSAGADPHVRASPPSSSTTGDSSETYVTTLDGKTAMLVAEGNDLALTAEALRAAMGVEQGHNPLRA